MSTTSTGVEEQKQIIKPPTHILDSFFHCENYYNKNVFSGNTTEISFAVYSQVNYRELSIAQILHILTGPVAEQFRNDAKTQTKT